MPIRAIDRTIPAVAVSEGAGVTVHRSLGTPALRHLDPFLMLDHFASDDPDEYIAGFPDHPHRGFITLTYMIDGHMRHADSMGNRGDLRTGGIQWMKAASGVIHSEMPGQTEGRLRGFQLWINLPAKEKMADPEYQEYAAERIPVAADAGRQVKVIAGDYAGHSGPIADPHTQVLYLDVTLDAGQAFAQGVPDPRVALLYLFDGSLRVGDESIPQHTLAVLGPGDQVQAQSGDTPARFILLAGRPIGEPIVQYGPFVMNTEREIRQAIDDFRQNRLTRTKASLRP